MADTNISTCALTPALSQGERGLFRLPLPLGEGRGEGMGWSEGKPLVNPHPNCLHSRPLHQRRHLPTCLHDRTIFTLLTVRRRWLEGGLCVVLGLAWFYLAFQVIIPAYRVGGGHSVYAAWFETLGNTPLEIALSPITKPDKVMALLFRPSNIEALLIITVPLALLPFAGLPMWLMSAPSVAFSLLSNNPTLRQLETWHYAAPMLPFLMLATIDGLGRIRNYELKIKNYKHHPSHLSPLTSHLSLLTSYLSPLTSIFLLLISLTYHHYRGYSPMSLLYEPLDVTTHHELGRQIAQTIPPDTPVLAQAQLIPYVAHREGTAPC